MFSKEIKRMFHSKASIIILFLIIVSVISFFISLSQKQMFIDQLNNDFSEDLNRTALSNLIENYTGWTFLFDFWYNSEFAQIYIFILYIWVGVFLSPILVNLKETGFGNMIVSRVNYSKFSTSVFLASSLYIVVIVFLATILQVILAFIIGGFGTTASIGEYDLNFIFAIFIAVIQTLNIAINVVLVNGLVMFSGTLIKNKYLLQALPLIVFAVVPMLLASTVGNLSHLFAKIIIYFEPFNVMMAVSNVFQAHFETEDILLNFSPIIVYFIVLFIMIVFDRRKNMRDYI